MIEVTHPAKEHAHTQKLMILLTFQSSPRRISQTKLEIKIRKSLGGVLKS